MSIIYNKSGDVIEITVRDMSMKKIEQWKFNVDDRKLGNKIFSVVLSKYGFKPEINHIEQAEQMKEIQKNKDDWLDMGMNL